MAKLKKSEKRLLIALGVIAVIGGIMLYRIYGPKKSNPIVIEEEVVNEEPQQNTKSTQRKTSSARSSGGGGGGGRSSSSQSSSQSTTPIQMTEFQKHSKKDDCWVLIEGNVYNITNVIKSYPVQVGTASEFCGTIGFEVGFLDENNIKSFILEKSEKVGTIG